MKASLRTTPIAIPMVTMRTKAAMIEKTIKTSRSPTPKIPRNVCPTAGYPTTLIIDADGRIVMREGGGATWDVPEAVAFIKGLLPQ